LQAALQVTPEAVGLVQFHAAALAGKLAALGCPVQSAKAAATAELILLLNFCLLRAWNDVIPLSS
jgi:hypothetical protein